MAARVFPLLRTVQEQKGQSLVEFLLMLPLLIGLAVITIRVNTVIQMSIVNQQYARAHTHFLTFGSPYYPARDFKNAVAPLGYNQMIIGVSDEVIAKGESKSPVAQNFMITRKKTKSQQGSDKDAEPQQTANPKVRTTVALCTHSVSLGGGSNYVPVSSASLNGAFKDPKAFAYCRSPYNE